jgi:hypothetical protein
VDFFSYVSFVMREKEKLTPFEETLTYQILKKRWSGKDMEQYFVDKNKAFIDKLKKDLKK